MKGWTHIEIGKTIYTKEEAMDLFEDTNGIPNGSKFLKQCDCGNSNNEFCDGSHTNKKHAN